MSGRIVHAVTVSLANQPGALNDVLTIMAGKGLNLVDVKSKRYACEPEAIALSFHRFHGIGRNSGTFARRAKEVKIR